MRRHHSPRCINAVNFAANKEIQNDVIQSNEDTKKIKDRNECENEWINKKASVWCITKIKNDYKKKRERKKKWKLIMEWIWSTAQIYHCGLIEIDPPTGDNTPIIDQFNCEHDHLKHRDWNNEIGLVCL
jgi:uncharacterized pyridoxal phosphate-containing UPF0001 family protein